MRNEEELVEKNRFAKDINAVKVGIYREDLLGGSLAMTATGTHILRDKTAFIWRKVKRIWCYLWSD